MPRRAPSKCLQDSWPLIDRQMWETGLEPGDILDGPNYAERLRPGTIQRAAEGYTCWLAFLRSQGPLDEAIPPAERVTVSNARAYLWSRREAGNGNATIVGRFSALRSALRIMQPEADLRWLTSPNGRWLGSLLPLVRRPIQVIDSDVLYEWGKELMEEAPKKPGLWQWTTHRNGLLIALFAARGPRSRSMAALQVGRHVVRKGDRYRIAFEAEDMKTHNPLEYDAPRGLSVAIEQYLTVTRPALLAGQSHSWFWVGQGGQRLAAATIGKIIRRLSGTRFGKAFGPHRFRHGIGTTAPLKDPAHPGIGAAILGISGRMVEEHYNRAGGAEAACRYHDSLREDRERTRSLARRKFVKQRAQS